MRLMEQKHMQAMALSRPCLLAEETAHPQYACQWRDGSSLVLTVNAGYE